MNVPKSLSHQEIVNWLVEKFSVRLDIEPASVDIHMLFTDFGIDSTEVLVLMGEIENWTGLEISPTAMWYNPTISQLATHIVEISASEH